MKPGTRVTFLHYGARKRGVVDRIANGLVWLTDGRWLHLESVEIDNV